MFSNAELNVEPIAHGFECRAECWTHSSTFKVCMVLNAKLNVDLIARYSGWIFSNAELNFERVARYSNCVLFRMQSWMSISQLDIQDVCFRMQSWMSNPQLDIQSVYSVECRAELRSQSSIFLYSSYYLLNTELRRLCLQIHSWISIVDPIANFTDLFFFFFFFSNF